jgi:hypothetical protein
MKINRHHTRNPAHSYPMSSLLREPRYHEWLLMRIAKLALRNDPVARRRAQHRRYNASEKGGARSARYDATPTGQARKAVWDACNRDPGLRRGSEWTPEMIEHVQHRRRVPERPPSSPAPGEIEAARILRPLGRHALLVAAMDAAMT